jgi:hypothetical protein
VSIGDLFKLLVPDVLKTADDAAAIARYGRGVQFRWESGLGWSGADVERLLRQHGIRVYARRHVEKEGDEYGVTVTTAQARWAERVMRGEGVPLTSPLYHESNRNVQAGRRIGRRWADAPGRKAQKPVGLAGRLLDWLG